MEIPKLYAGLYKIIDLLGKTGIETFTSHKGIYTGMENGQLTILSFSKKLESNILPLLYKKYNLNIPLIKFMHGFFIFEDMIFTEDGFQIYYRESDLAGAKAHKNALSFFQSIYKIDDEYIVNIPYIDIYTESVSNFFSYMQNIDHSSIESTDIDIYNVFNTNEKPLDISIGKYFTRLAKSTFKTVVKGDKANIKFFSYHENDMIFLTVATVNKSDCQIINVFNSLYMTEEE